MGKQKEYISQFNANVLRQVVPTVSADFSALSMG